MARPRKNVTPNDGTIIVEEGQNAITTVIEGAESVTPIPDEGNTYIAEPTPVESPPIIVPSKGGIGAKRGRKQIPVEEEGFGTNAKYVRDMRLTSEQKSMIVLEEVRKILTSKRPDELQGGMIPCFIDYPSDVDGFTVIYTFIKADTRLVSKAWRYYKDNAENPTVKNFVNEVQKIVGRGEQYRRVDHLHLFRIK